MNKKECTNIGLKHYNNPDGGKFTCCESILLALSDYLEIESDIIPSIASSLGGGLGGCGETCGCITGAAMALGLKFGRSSAEESKDEAYAAVRRLVDLFQDKYGTAACKDLIGMRMRDAELTADEKQKLHDDVCNGIMENTISWTVDILDS